MLIYEVFKKSCSFYMIYHTSFLDTQLYVLYSFKVLYKMKESPERFVSDSFNFF